MEIFKNIQLGERLSFYKLFKEKNYRVLIPIIQRDYAQGRKNKKEVRDTFLSALYKYLEENKPNRDLDFVYGSLNIVGDQTDFIPLDGQQRLTTLFLLHWFLYQIQEDKNSEICQNFKQALLKEDKSMFTYETRTSSSDFCNALMTNEVDLNNLINIDEKEGVTKENQLSKTIENSAWYFLSWRQDPTIQSMLTMLDAIFEKFADKKEFFERLLNVDNPIITFQFLNLKDFKLTDDLYIKMNSRGKPLTSFENFKAKFEQYLENIKITSDETFQLTFDGITQNVSLNKYFSYNIDTKWADLFWAYRELEGNKDTYDEELKNFIRVIFTSQYATSVQIRREGNIEKTDDTFEFLLGTVPARKRADYTDDISFYKYDELNALSENGVLFLIHALDNLIIENDKLKRYKFYFDDKEIFKNALKHSFANNQERIMFHAYIRFLIHNATDRSGIEQWMRVIHNLAYNTIIDGAVEIARAIKSIEKMLPGSSIEKMLPGSDDILDYIIGNEIDFFAAHQVLEEKIKAHLIRKSNDWKKIIGETEQHSFFDGQIGFILAFSGILDYYNENHNCDWPSDKEYFDRFVNYSKKATAIFKYRNGKAYSDFLLERAVMTKGICAVRSSQKSITTVNRFNLLHTNVVANNIARDYSWKRFLRINIDGSCDAKMIHLKELFDDNRLNDLNDKNVKDLLNSFLSDRTNSWRDFFITNPSLMRYCEKGFIKVDNDNKIYLLRKIYQGANQYFAEMHSYCLWKERIENDSFGNFFSEKDYFDSISHAISPHIFLKFSHYKIDIYWDSDKQKFKLLFNNDEDYNKTEDDYSLEIKDLLTNKLRFNWETDCYMMFLENNDNVKNKIDEICQAFK